MLVLVTGGTGFLGSHTAAALTRAGHRVRVLARDPARVPGRLAPLGADACAVETAAGDVTDAVAVRRALRGCDAVLHAAGVYSFDTRDRARLAAVNVRGTETVLEAARAAGTGRVIHVSTFGALLPGTDDPLTVHSAVGVSREPYLAAKAAAERIARGHQATGTPVTICYPPATLGPYDPGLGDQTTRIRNALRGLMPFWPRGGFPVGDVRDVAELHVALLAPEIVGDRWFAPGRYTTTTDLVAALRRVTGRALPALFPPARAMLPLGRLAGAAQRVLPVHLPAEYGAIYTCAVGRPVDTAATDRLLGHGPRPLETTLADTVAWLHAAGHVDARRAGHAAADRPDEVRKLEERRSRF
ncbi:SDR family NAD(P)-dependent oxidoreductase [Actinoplanes siamensis]|uniref:NAD-dependent epimerase n=1 Tax=Actinoplanes siamensis TaxID=1223317 RepID=A0A919TLV6_9ACTN|nr:SDR family NAD(P)-dependent oxidoreductase [Actinoplanes siamensis]GIF07012.1 NAD-dependent epimerase [Actinoplanes siamensis]